MELPELWIINLVFLTFNGICSLIARILLFRRAKIKVWKAFIPILCDVASYKAVGMSGLWFFSSVPHQIITLIPGLNVPVWLTALTYVIEYGVDLLFAIKLVKAFQRKKKVLVTILSIGFPIAMQLYLPASKKSKYDEHYNRYKYRLIGGKFVELKDVKKAKLAEQKRLEKEARDRVLAEPEPPEKKGGLKKLTDNIVKHHKLVLISILILTALCGYLATKTNVNRDLTKYLPESSEMSKGLNLMYDEFEDVLAMPLSVMVDNLSDEEKQTEKTYLQNLDGVSMLTYNDSEEYNKDNHTLYELTVKGKADSDNAATVLKTIQDHYKEMNKPLAVRGEVATMNSPVLPLWVIAIAVVCAVIVLIIMSESYVEPLLFLAAIGLAVVINMGTNALLPSVSQITNSITSILQLALSMDYSIMLATEYHREKIRGKNKIEAMKAALSRSFTAIASSSVTTIVGMLVLLLMSFTIGADLGIVLAKGVLLCLFSILTALPALLLIFDNLVEKTKKRPFSPNLSALGRFSYAIHKFAIPVFLVLMGGFFYLQTTTGTLYTNTASETIDNVFGPFNQTVLVYDRYDEDAASTFCHAAEADSRTTSVLCRGNTLNEPEKSTELVPKFASLGTEADISQDLINFVYYHSYDKNESHRLSFKELLEFLRTDAKQNSLVSSRLPANLDESLDKLEQFVYAEPLDRWRSLGEISNLLDINYGSLNDLMVLYGSYIPAWNTMTLQDFSNFIKSDVLTNPSYSGAVSEAMLEKLDLLDILLKISDYLEPTDVEGLDLISDADVEEFLNKFDIPVHLRKKIITLLGQLRFVLKSAVNHTELTASVISQNLGVDQTSLNLLYSLKRQNSGTGIYGLSLRQLITFLHDTVLNSAYAPRLTSDQATKINAIYRIMNDADGKHSAGTIYEMLSPLASSINKTSLELLAIFHGSLHDLPEDYKMTVEEFINFINDDILKDERLKDSLNSEVRNKIVEAKGKISSANKQFVAKHYGRIIIRSKLDAEGEETMAFIKDLRDRIAYRKDDEPDETKFTEQTYLLGNSAMSYEMSQSFGTEMTIITIVTAVAIYIVVAISFKSVSLPLVLVLVIQTAVWITMSITGLTDGSIYFLSIIIVQSILMGATIDYAIMYSEQYLAARKHNTPVKDACIFAYNQSIQPILTSAGVLTIVTAIVGNFATGNAAKICKSLSDGAFFSTLLILLFLPALIAACDKIIVRGKLAPEKPAKTLIAKSAKK